MSSLCFSTLCFLFLWLLPLFPLATRCYPWLSEQPVHCLPTISISVVVRRFHRWHRFRRCLGLPHRLRRIGHCPFLFHLANPTTVCFGHHCLAFYPSIDGPVWLVSCRPPVLITVLAEVRHLAALGHWLFVHSGHLCRHLCWLDIIWRHALILVRFVPLSRSRFGCCPTTPISGHYGQSPLLFYRFPLFGLCSADSDSDSGQCLRGCVCPVLSNRWFSSYCCRSSRFSAIPDVPDVVFTIVFSTALSGRRRCSCRC